MHDLRHGSTGPRVALLQRLLGDLVDDGIFGPKTDAALRRFQAPIGLAADGVADEATWDKIVAAAESAGRAAAAFGRLPVERVDLPGTAPLQVDEAGRTYTYTSFSLRSDVAAALRGPVAHVTDRGGVVTSAGGIRALNDGANATRAAASGHYLGRDLDLALPSGMHAPAVDPFVVERAPDLGERRWRVWARVHTGGEERTLRAVMWGRSNTVAAWGRFVDWTALLADAGFVGIPARSSSWWEEGGALPEGPYTGTEWWHASHRAGLVRGETTFGDELLRLYPLATLRRTKPWALRHRVFGEGWW